MKPTRCSILRNDIEKLVGEQFRLANLDHPAMRQLRKLVVKQWESRGKLPAASKEFNAIPTMTDADGSILGCDIDELLAEDVALPALPQAFFELQEILHDDAASPADVAKIISLDPQLTARLLTIVNSSLFSLTHPVGTVSRAVAVMGTRQISALALGTIVLGLFHKKPTAGVNLEFFWTHSISVALAARELAVLVGRQNTEQAFIAGLLHDIGWLAFCCLRPAVAATVLDSMHDSCTALLLAEQQRLPFDHSELGAQILERWNLPTVLVNTVRYHHSPSALHAEAEGSLETSLVHVADTLSWALGYGYSGCNKVLPLDPVAWDRTKLTTENLITVTGDLDENLNQLIIALQGGQAHRH